MRKLNVRMVSSPFTKEIGLVVVIQGHLKLATTDVLSKIVALKGYINGNIEARGDGFRKVLDGEPCTRLIDLNSIVMLLTAD